MVAHTLSQVWLLWSICYMEMSLGICGQHSPALSPLPHPEAGPGAPGWAQTQPATSGLARMKRSGGQ